jgi:1,2-diacylglycerol 3-alpha-glucosyltransferase
MARVAILFDNFGPYHLARLRAAAGECDLLAIEIAQRSGEYAWDAAPSRRGFQSECLFEGTSSKLDAAAIAARLDTVFGRFKADAVAVPGWASRTSLGSVAWCLKRRVPLVVMSESQAIDERRSAWKEFIKRQIVGCFSAALVGGVPHMDYLTQLGLPRERLFQGYDAVDNPYFAKGAEEVRRGKAEMLKAEMPKAEGQGRGGNAETLKTETLKAGVCRPSSVLRPQPGLPERYFLASARFVEKKNLARLLQAFAKYREKAETLKAEKLQPEGQRTESAEGNAEMLKAEMLKADGLWDLVLLGDGPLRSALNSQLSTLNLHGHVQMPGFKQYPELPVYYGLASAFVHASTTEQWGLVVNEAMASGLPVLVSNRCGCAPDLVQEGVNGFTFDPYNVEQLAQLMLKISAFQPFSLSAFGNASRRIIADWGPERFASGLKAAVDKALEVGPVKPTLVQRMVLKALLWK